MICDNCNRTGIRWMGPLTDLTHTECPHCGGRNCQRPDDDHGDFDDDYDDADRREQRERLYWERVDEGRNRAKDRQIDEAPTSTGGPDGR